MQLEGVLSDTDDLRTTQPSHTGKYLYEALKGSFRLVLMTSAEPELAHLWLRKERITGYGQVLYHPPSSIQENVDWKRSQIREIQSEGWPIVLYLDVDPVAVRMAFLEGLHTLLLASPRYSRPEWRPDGEYKVRSWDDLVSTIEEENLSKADKEG
jgi:hypothetical protein